MVISSVVRTTSVVVPAAAAEEIGVTAGVDIGTWGCPSVNSDTGSTVVVAAGARAGLAAAAPTKAARMASE